MTTNNNSNINMNTLIKTTGLACLSIACCSLVVASHFADLSTPRLLWMGITAVTSVAGALMVTYNAEED